MANPFITQYNKKCDYCEAEIILGREIYIHNSDRICIDCAEEADVVCDCGNYLKEGYEKCYTCFTDSETYY